LHCYARPSVLLYHLTAEKGQDLFRQPIWGGREPARTIPQKSLLHKRVTVIKVPRHEPWPGVHRIHFSSGLIQESSQPEGDVSMARAKELDTDIPYVVEFQDLETIEGMRGLCQEKIRDASTPAERNTYQRLLKLLDLRFHQLKEEKAAKVAGQ
jgi:hypothetical protein